jgi:hypothetical protein
MNRPFPGGRLLSDISQEAGGSESKPIQNEDTTLRDSQTSDQFVEVGDRRDATHSAKR